MSIRIHVLKSTPSRPETPTEHVSPGACGGAAAASVRTGRLLQGLVDAGPRSTYLRAEHLQAGEVHRAKSAEAMSRSRHPRVLGDLESDLARAQVLQRRASSSSAFSTIDRNLYIVNRRPFRPQRRLPENDRAGGGEPDQKRNKKEKRREQDQSGHRDRRYRRSASSAAADRREARRKR